MNLSMIEELFELLEPLRLVGLAGGGDERLEVGAVLHVASSSEISCERLVDVAEEAAVVEVAAGCCLKCVLRNALS